MGSGKNRKYMTVSGVLPEVVRHQGWAAKLEMHSFFPIWEKVVGENVACCSRPLKIVKDVLWLEVESSTWMQQLQFEKMRILDDINATLTRSRIRDIRFLLPRDEEQGPSKELPEIIFVSPDPEALRKFEKQVGIIEDEAIRESLIRLWYLTKACRRKQKS
ncbi:DUF721 domain-containing protein [Desulfopila inferna]|uniref:DUF721 domain-containing protein n=1 Tax=Desulfopila inferna TaxID=468528 RepID=UPI001964EA70|nr:DUF721 domain-containing protein [Desulfopila inferna]MBM9605173.1 DUF721 domain-containing protein [Desulfopila inferna]